MPDLSGDYLDALCEIDNMCMSAAATRVEKKAGKLVKLIKPKAKQGILSQFISALPDADKAFLTMSFSNTYSGDFMFVFLKKDIDFLISAIEKNQSVSSEEAIKTFAQDISEGIKETMSMLTGKQDVDSQYTSFKEALDNGWEEKDVVFIEMQFKISDEVSSHFWHIVPADLGLVLSKDMLGEIDSKLEEFSEKVTTEEKKPEEKKDIDVEINVPVELCVEICRKEVRLKELWNLSIGSIIEFKKGVKESLDIVIKGKPYGKAQVVTVGERFGVRITEVVNYGEGIGR